MSKLMVWLFALGLRSFLERFLCCAAAAAAMSTFVFGQTGGGVKVVPLVRNPNQPISFRFGLDPARNAAALRAASAGDTIPLWSYTVLAHDGNTYEGVMVGTNPFEGGGTTTTVDSPIIPVIVRLGPYTYDPTSPDPCLDGNTTVLDLVLNSPIFRSTDYIMNGIDVGNTQYVDAFQRANFWSLIGGTEYHTLLNPRVLRAQTYTAEAYVSDRTYCGGTTRVGAIEESAFDYWINNVALSAAGVSPTQFPILLLQNVVIYSGTIDTCCAGGYHSARPESFQTYSPSDIDTAGFFGDAPCPLPFCPLPSPDVAILAHEVAEWMDDPLSNNAAPLWGNTGQVVGCIDWMEVADPLTGTLFPIVTMNGFDYHLQELAFFSWFFGGDSIGAGGMYSNNGTFTAPSAPCP